MAASGFGELHVAPHGTVWVGWGAGPRPLASGTLASECGVWMGGGGRACKPPGGLGVGPPLAQFPGSPAQPRDSCDGCAQLPAGCGRAQGSWRQKGRSRPARRQSLLVRATENLLGRGLPPSAMCEVQVSSSAQRLGPEGSRVLERCPQPEPSLCTKSEPSSANPRRLPAWMDGPPGPRASALGAPTPEESSAPQRESHPDGRRPTGPSGPMWKQPSSGRSTTTHTRGKGVAARVRVRVRSPLPGEGERDQLGQSLLPGLRKPRGPAGLRAAGLWL